MMTGTSRMTTLVATIVPTLAVVMAFSKWGSKNVMMGMKSKAMRVSMIAARPVVAMVFFTKVSKNVMLQTLKDAVHHVF